MPGYTAVVRVSLKEGVLDPEAKTIQRSLERLGFGVEGLKRAEEYEVTLTAPSEEDARHEVLEMCERLLANPVIHDYSVEVEPR